MAKTRETIVDGIFYPAGKKQLRDLVFRLLDEAPGGPLSPLAVLSPHGAFEKSGLLTAAAFKASSQLRPEQVVVIGPVHREKENTVILPDSESFSCPVGPVEVDKESVELLLSCGTQFVVNDIPHLEEHSLEVQLPFIKLLFPEARLVPILLGSPAPSVARTLSRALQVLLRQSGRSTLIVGSVNLTGYLPRDRAREEAEQLTQLILKRDLASLLKAGQPGGLSSCGLGCLAAILELPETGPVRLLGRAETEDEAGKAVGYGAFSLGVLT